MTNDIRTLAKAMMGTRRYKENVFPTSEDYGHYTLDFDMKFCEHMQRAIDIAKYSAWTYMGTALYTRSEKYVSTVSKFKDEQTGNQILFISTPTSKDFINLSTVLDDMLELKETDTDTYLKLLKILHKGE